MLPTEGQWECAARAGTDTPWWSGPRKESLRDAENLCDQAFTRVFTTVIVPEEWDDGFPAHAPVGSFRANGFGLHDVHGNVWEWCWDWYVPFGTGHAAGDGAHLEQPSDDGRRTRVDRGGSFLNPAITARSAYRSQNPTDSRFRGLGCRPAMAIEKH